MSGPRASARVRCPDPSCGAEFEVSSSSLGRNGRCPSCGRLFTYAPAELRERASAMRTGSSPARRLTMPVAVVLENVRSLWNVGSIFRTCDGAGAEELWLCGYTGRPPREEISKTALGAELVVPWRGAPTALDAVRELRSRGRTILALERTETSAPIEGARVLFPCALLLGNEVAGLSEEALTCADAVYHIPMYGAKTSLNVAVAAGIALYELRRAASRDRRPDAETREHGGPRETA